MKNKLFIALHLALVWVAMLLVVQPADAQFKLPFIARDNGNDSLNLVTKRDTVYFGVHPQATYCIDANAIYFTPCDSVKESELPPKPPSGVFDIRFVDLDSRADSDPCILGLEQDITSYTGATDVDTFQVAFQPGAGKYPFIFRWPKNLDQFADSMRVKGTNINVNMFTQDSVKVTSALVKSLLIVVYHPKSQTIPTTPTLSAPANFATAVDTPVTFTWQPSAGATSYVLQISTSPTFTTILKRDTGATTSRVIHGLAYNATYYWRVAANTPYLSGCYTNPPFSFTSITLCNAPTLALPADNATGTATAPTLSWTAPAGATVLRYEVQVAVDSNFAAVVYNNTNVSGTSVTINPLPNCVTRYWRVRTVCDAGTSPYSAKRKFTVVNAVPDVPALTAPAANASNINPSVTLTLQWTALDSCSKSYRVQVSVDTTDADPAHLFLNDSVQTASRAVTGLQEGTNYFWRVRSAGGAGVGAYSAWRMFHTIILPPAAPTLLSPATGDTSVPISAILRWTTVVRADSYQVQVATDAGFAAIVYTSPYLPDTTATAGPLVSCTQYFWKVRAKNIGGVGSFSSARNFKVASAPPAAPLLTFPANGQDSVDGEPTLTWAPGDVCTRFYHVVVSLSAGLGSPIVDATQAGTSIAIGPLESNTTYFWRVTPIGSAGNGTPSAVFSFITTPFTAPPVPALLSPPNRQSNVAFPASVCWDSSARATSYRLQVAIDSTFGTKIFDDSTLVLRCRTLAGLLNGKTYFWRVSAKNGAGTSAFSPFFRFTTLSPPQPPLLISPANGEEGVNAVAQFLWSIPETAESYRFQLAKDSLFAQIVKDDSTIAVTSTQAGPLDSHRKYFWRVRGKNTAGVGAYSAVWSFRTDYVGVSNWSMPLNVRENGNAQETVYFGLHPDATYGIDPTLGEFELPPPDLFGTFDVRFVGPPLRPTSIGEGLRLNLLEFRNYTQVDTYKVRFQPGFGGYPMAFTWSAGFVRIVCDSMLLVDEFGGNTVRRRMDLDSSALVTNTSLSSLLIIKYGAHPILDVPMPGRESELPKGFALSQNYPNPFNPSTTIRFSTEDVADIDVIVYDVLGRLVARLTNRTYFPGAYAAVWDGKNEQGMVMPSGMYYVRMTAVARSSGAGDPVRFSATRKMLLLK
jgi:hypothetical protein